MMVWQDHDRNEWALSIDNALAADQASLLLPTDAMDPFSLGDPAAVTTILDAAGFVELSFTDVHEPVFYGRDVSAALDWVRTFADVRRTLQQLEPSSREHRLIGSFARSTPTLAPTAFGSIRAAGSSLAPSLTHPVINRCASRSAQMSSIAISKASTTSSARR